MDKLPKITIIIPVKNAGKTLQITLNSLKSQNYNNLEVIVMDGLSDDNTMEIVNNNMDIIQIAISEKDESGASAVNKAIGLSSGDIIGFLYGDDYLTDDALEIIGEKVRENPHYDFYSYGLSIEELFSRKIIFESYNEKNIALNMHNALFKHVLNHFYKKNIFQEHGLLTPLYYDGTVFISNDREFLIRLAVNNLKNLVIEKILYKMTFHKESFTGSRDHIVKIREEHIGIADHYISLNNLSNYKKRKLTDFKSHNLSLLLVWYFYKLDFGKFFYTFNKGFKLKGLLWFIDVFKCPLSELVYRASVKKWM